MTKNSASVNTSATKSVRPFVKFHRDIFRLACYADRSPLRQALVRTLICSPYKTHVPGFTRCTLDQLAQAVGYCPRSVRAELNSLAAEGEVVFDYWKTGFLFLPDMQRCPPRRIEQVFRWGNTLLYLVDTTNFLSFAQPLLDLVANSAPHIYQGVMTYFAEKFVPIRHFVQRLKNEINVKNKVHALRPVHNSPGLSPMQQLPLIAPAGQEPKRQQKAESTAANCARRLRELLGVRTKARAPLDVRDWEIWWCHVPGLRGVTRTGKGKQVGIFRAWVERGLGLKDVQAAVDTAIAGGRLGPHSCLLAYADGVLRRWRK